MAFTSTVLSSGDATGQGIVLGKYVSSGGGTGGECATGFSRVSSFKIQPFGSSVAGNAPVVNETIGSDGTIPGSVTIVTDADESGYWEARGF